MGGKRTKSFFPKTIKIGQKYTVCNPKRQPRIKMKFCGFPAFAISVSVARLWGFPCGVCSKEGDKAKVLFSHSQKTKIPLV